jgi:hypothetical protein
MRLYDPEIAPDPEEWLELDEQERIQLVEEHHEAAGIRLPNVTVHAAIQAIVENQITEGVESVVRAMARLEQEGLSRHDALHAVGSVVAEYFFSALQAGDGPTERMDQAAFDAAVERLSGRSWREKYGKRSSAKPSRPFAAALRNRPRRRK